MLYLNPNTPKIIKAKMAFYQGMIDFVFNRIDSIKRMKDVDYTKIECFFDLYINDQLDEILIGMPSKLIEISSKYGPFINNNLDLKRGIEYVFNYDLFIKHTDSRFDAYKLAESLDISTCSYCNRNFTNTVIKENGKKITRPQFDHYFDKANHPILAISFFNLIPSCSICNSCIKGIKKLDLNNFTHPYVDNPLYEIRFTYQYSNKSKNGLKIKVITPENSKAKNTINAFEIEEVYNSHTGEIQDLLKTKQYFSEKYLSILKSKLLKDNINISKEEMYRIIFGTEYLEKNFINRPLSKFKSDILKELGII